MDKIKIFVDRDKDINIFNVDEIIFDKIKKVYTEHHRKLGDTEWIDVNKIVFFKKDIKKKGEKW